MLLNFFKKHKWALFFSALLMNFSLASFAFAMPIGTLLYRTSSDGNLYGYNTDELVVVKNKMIKNIYTGHVGIYVGKEDGVDYIVEALPDGLIKVPAKYFLNENNGEELIGAKIPKNLNEVQRVKVAQLAKKLADSNLAYDFDFKEQKGPNSGEWICVGLTEKIYESADILNPLDLSRLEYDPRFYAINITPDGFDDYSIQNKENGDCLSKDLEFSKIFKNKGTVIPLPELIGFNSGFEYEDERYFFFPLTQFMQDSLEDVTVDIDISSKFNDDEVRGRVPEVAMIFKWSFINNPFSSLAKIVKGITSVFAKGDEVVVDLDDMRENVENQQALQVQEGSENVLAKSSTSFVAILDKKENSEVVNSGGLSGKLQSLVTVDKTYAVQGYSSNSELSVDVVSLEKNIEEKEPEESVLRLESFEVLRSNLLISKVYSTLSDDYIEIYNPNTFSIDLEEAGVRLYKTKTSATPSLMIRIGNLSDGIYPKGVVVPANGRYVIARASASDEIKSMANAISNRSEFTFVGDAYTIYLSSGVVSSDNDEDIVDKLGFGSASYFEKRPALEILDEHVLLRKAKIDSDAEKMKEGGSHFLLAPSYDSNDNFFDFVLVNLSNDQNTENNNQDIENDSQNNEQENNNTNNSLDNEQENNQDEDQEEIQDNLLPLLISKVYSTGNDDYIEIYNPNDVTIDLAEKGFRLYKAKTSVTPSLLVRFGNLSDASYPGGLNIEPYSKYLISREAASDEIKAMSQAIVSRSEFTFTGDAYTIYLSDDVLSSDNDEDIVDKIGFGNAKYFLGSPAPEILDNNILIRKAKEDSEAIDMAVNCEDFEFGNSFNSCNNNFDFVSLSLDDYYNNTVCDNNYEFDHEEEQGGGEGADDEQSQEENQVENFDVYNYCLDPAIISEDILNLWHFDECQGDFFYDFSRNSDVENISASWVQGKFGCAISHHQDNDIIKIDLDSALDSNKFTYVFDYKLPYSSSRPVIKFYNSSNEQYFSVQLYRHYTEFRGFPNTPNRLEYLEWPVDDIWHQFALVVDKGSDYFALYNDGQEVFRGEIGLNFFPDIDSLFLVATGNYTVFDEMAVFKKPLSPEELNQLYNYNLPFNSSDCVNKRFKKPELLSYFNTDDNQREELEDKTILYDMAPRASSSQLVLNNNQLNLDRGNYYLLSDDGDDFIVSGFLEQIEYYKDLSLSLWLKKNSDKDLDDPLSFNQFYLKLVGNNKDVFGINLDNRFNYYFNDLNLTAEDDISDLGFLNDNWHHLVLVYDSYKFELKIYLDGYLKKTVSRDWLDYEFIENIIISSENGSSYVDEISIWSGVIDDFDAKQLYNSKKMLFN